MHKSPLYGAASFGAMLALALGANVQAQETAAAWKGAPEFKAGDMTFKVSGRVYYDYVGQDVDRAIETGANVDYEASAARLRTARLGVSGTWTDRWSYKAEMSMNGRDDPQWEDIVLEFRPRKGAALRLGHMKTVSLENLTSSRYTTFMERGAFNDAIDAGRTTAVQGALSGAAWTATVSVIGDNINDPDPPVNPATGSAREALGASARVTFAPIDTDTTKLHLGGWARYREANDDSLFRYRARNNTNYGDRFIDTGAGFDGDTTLAAEAALVWNSLSAQAEYASIDADPAASAAADGNVTAGYGFVSWFPTGEMRAYRASKGAFDRVKVLRPVTAGGFGAVELGLRYDFVDATDFAGLNPAAGEYGAWTAGATWYPFSHVRFMANYSRAETDNAGTTFRDVEVQTLQFRAQFDF